MATGTGHIPLQWFSIPQAARYTGFTTPTIRAAISNGLLKARRVHPSGPGTRASVRIKRDDLDRWIEGDAFGDETILK
jgi:excisionase family DNA binding protein